MRRSILALAVALVCLVVHSARAGIYRANLDGSGAELLFGTGIQAQGIAFDAVGGQIYWQDWRMNPPPYIYPVTYQINRAYTDGSGMETLSGLFYTDSQMANCI